MDQTNIETEPQEQQTTEEQRAWVTPTFECTELKEALSAPPVTNGPDLGAYS